MSPILLFPLAILTPFLLTAVLLLPLYAGILGAAYIIYMPETGAHPLATHLIDVFYILDVYGKLFEYWSQHTEAVAFTDYTLPLLGLPALGIIIAFYGAYKLITTMVNLFRLTAAI